MRLSCTFLQQRQSGYELTMVNMSSDEYLGLRNRASTLVCVFDHQMQQPSALRPFPKRPPIGPQSARLHPPKVLLFLSSPQPQQPIQTISTIHPSVHLPISLSPRLLVSSFLRLSISLALAPALALSPSPSPHLYCEVASFSSIVLRFIPSSYQSVQFPYPPSPRPFRSTTEPSL
ncbi:predicted protein [Histoplasma capsulatum var. duboisii H88]|uniref:Predicted protein n=1 Tax=Ajellomyces capsulatus (strain H88) TaxID=544711 RepID=F0UME4_AJEC8|nr:predicted protein [Histoplasma capsulatum var. duboisii H88]